jgi:hypothetical protein
MTELQRAFVAAVRDLAGCFIDQADGYELAEGRMWGTAQDVWRTADALLAETEALTPIAAMVANQQPLDPDAARILYENKWDLYDSAPAPGTEGSAELEQLLGGLEEAAVAEWQADGRGDESAWECRSEETEDARNRIREHVQRREAAARGEVVGTATLWTDNVGYPTIGNIRLNPMPAFNAVNISIPIALTRRRA